MLKAAITFLWPDTAYGEALISISPASLNGRSHVLYLFPRIAALLALPQIELASLLAALVALVAFPIGTTVMIVDIPSRQGHGVSARLRLRLRTLFEKARVDIRICHSEESLQMISNSRERDLGGCEKRPQIASDVDWAGKRATAKINTLTWPSGYERPGQLIARAAKCKQKAFSSLKGVCNFALFTTTYFDPTSLFLCKQTLNLLPSCESCRHRR